MNDRPIGREELKGFGGLAVVIDYDLCEVRLMKNGHLECNYTGPIGKRYIKLIRDYWNRQRDYEELNSLKKKTDEWTVEACHRNCLEQEIA